MDNQSLLKKYAPGDNIVDLELDDLGSFGWLRGIRDRCTMVELRQRTGKIRAIGYAYIDRIDFDPSQGIVISAGSSAVTIKGRNLNGEVKSATRLFEGLTRQKVSWIQERSQADSMESRPMECIVDEIRW